MKKNKKENLIHQFIQCDFTIKTSLASEDN